MYNKSIKKSTGFGLLFSAILFWGIGFTFRDSLAYARRPLHRFTMNVFYTFLTALTRHGYYIQGCSEK